MNELALFAGAGGGILGGHLLGWRTVCAVEWGKYPASVLLARQNDGILPAFPIWDDVQTFDGKPWRGIVDVVSGGFPCQDISAAGGGAGIDGARSGMWKHMARIIGEVRPKCVFVENSPLLVGRGLAVVLGDLAALGYDAQWFCLSASDCGAPHQRDRIWLVANAACEQHQGKPYAKQRPAAAKLLANADGMRKLQPERSQQNKRGWVGNSSQDMANPGCNNVQRIFTGIAHAEKWSGPKQRQAGSRSDGSRWWPTEPNVGRVANGVAARVDRLKAIGNGQVPRVAATAFNILSD